MRFVVLGLSITSSWGNGHATTYRALLKELSALGHDILFLEKDVPYYASNRDLEQPDFCSLGLYTSLKELQQQYPTEVSEADVVIIGSYVPQGVEVAKWVLKTAKGITAFYDIDTPVTLAKMERQDFEYLDPEVIKKYDLYFSFTGGPILNHLEQHFGTPRARALYCSVDSGSYYPEPAKKKWQLGYLGTYSDDRQPTLNELLVAPAQAFSDGRFVVAGPQYPSRISWPANVERIEHLPPAEHRHFYNSQQYTLNVTRRDMIKAGYSPSVRLFEAAACGVPIISDAWEGLDSLFEPMSEILIAQSSQQVLDYFRNISEENRKLIGERARKKVLSSHTARARAKELENYIMEVLQPTLKVNG